VKPRNDRWTYGALAVSVALHGAAFVVVVRTPDRTVPAAQRTRISLVEVEFPAPEPAPPPPPVEAPVEPKVAPRPTPQVPRVKPAPTPPIAAEAPPIVSDRPQADAPVEPRLEAPRIERPSLVPGGRFALSLDAGAFLDDDEPKGLRAPTVSKDLVGDLTRETIGRGKVDRGLVHPYYVQLGKALIKNWDADRAMNQKGGLSGYGEQFVQNTKLFNEIWLDKAAQFGATGAPIDAPVSNDNASRRTALVNNGIQGIQGVDLEARKEVSRQMREQFKTTRRATIRVTQDLGGKLLKVELLSPSNDATVDKEAMADVRAAAEKLPPPPAEATEGKQSLVSVWAFELVVSISPPVPTFTFEFDEALGFIDARLPLDRRIYKKVRLVSVD
jgi:outer membrane biosynthesis protein TonB